MDTKTIPKNTQGVLRVIPSLYNRNHRTCIEHRIMYDSKLSHLECRVLLIIADRININYGLYGVDTAKMVHSFIASIAKISTRTVRRVIVKLKELNYIGSITKKGGFSYYFLLESNFQVTLGPPCPNQEPAEAVQDSKSTRSLHRIKNTVYKTPATVFGENQKKVIDLDEDVVVVVKKLFLNMDFARELAEKKGGKKLHKILLYIDWNNRHPERSKIVHPSGFLRQWAHGMIVDYSDYDNYLNRKKQNRENEKNKRETEKKELEEKLSIEKETEKKKEIFYAMPEFEREKLIEDIANMNEATKGLTRKTHEVFAIELVGKSRDEILLAFA